MSKPLDVVCLFGFQTKRNRSLIKHQDIVVCLTSLCRVTCNQPSLHKIVAHYVLCKWLEGCQTKQPDPSCQSGALVSEVVAKQKDNANTTAQ